MPQIKVEGRLDIADAIVGTIEGADPAQSIIIAHVPETLRPKEKKHIITEIRTNAENHFVSQYGLEPEGLKYLFNRLSAEQISLELDHKMPVVDMLAFMLERKDPKNILMCKDKKSYLLACETLGLSKSDLLALAELNAFLPSDEKTTAKDVGKRAGKVVGHARKIAQAFDRKEVHVTGLNKAYRMIPDRSEMVSSWIMGAKKYYMGELANFNGFSETFSPNRVFLPYEKCFFEYDVTHNELGHMRLSIIGVPGNKPQGTEEESKAKKVCPAFGIIYETKNNTMLLPLMLMYDSHDQTWAYIVADSLVGAHDKTGVKRLADEIMSSLKDTETIQNIIGNLASGLDYINRPGFVDRTFEEDVSKRDRKKAKRTGIPITQDSLFTYSDVDVLRHVENKPTLDFTKASKAVSYPKRKGPVYEKVGVGWGPGLEQPLHFRKAHERRVRFGDGTYETRIIGTYKAGSEENGFHRTSAVAAVQNLPAQVNG